ncbi:glycoside hydrolase family 78 protein [Micromonospora rifamycinica]|uniref:alpha-L-rhamnosidase n=1 Tax=Micromonospora rifamycinica TaxID=291594 RepID=UPI002E2A58EE|nr:family 78 glycoside hydrolase catalytic domain [Micromonospora rifamycinica]
MADVRVGRVRFGHLRTALGIGDRAPRLSWRTESAPDGWRQAGYEVEVDGTTHRVTSPDSVGVPWPAPELRSRDRRTVRVRATGVDGLVSSWSAPATVEAGLLEPADWTARLVTPPDGPAPLVRRCFTLDAPVASARLYVTAHGLYRAEINGRPVGADAFTPGWTSYHHRLRYQTYEVTDLLRPGGNVLGAQLADGWFRGRLTFATRRRNVYGDRLALLAQLEIVLADGRTVTVGTDASWRSATGPVTSADLYNGEHHDARLEQPGWSAPGFDDRGWRPCAVRDLDPGVLVAPDGPPVRLIERVPVRAVLTSPSGRTLLDFGQNLVGTLEIRPKGPTGTTVTLRHAEVLEHGELGVRPLRTAAATDRYTLRGDPEGERWRPHFTFHGFRYAEVTGWPEELRADDVTALVHHSDLERTGWFACSDPLLTRLHGNVVWSMRGNFLDVPTDCPQRDERLGWTGDIQVFAPTASYLYDCAGFLTSWLKDLAADQTPDGIVPLFVPRVDLGGPFAEPVGHAGWGDAAVLVPWAVYRHFGDTGILRRQYPSMCAWVDGVTAALGGRPLFDEPELTYGDWLDPTAPPDNPAAAVTDPVLVGTAYRVHTARVLSRIARILGEEADADRFAALAERCRRAFCDEYVSPNGRLVGDSPTGYALALEFALLDDDRQRARAAERLVEVVRSRGHRIATGFLGTPLICDALVTAGALDDAYQLLTQRECPSWLYPVTMDATTVWERWDAMLPDGSVNPGEMTSFNHYALGAVADWMHRVLGGLAPGAPGYRVLTVAPRPGGGVAWARTAHLTPYGRAEVSWRRADGLLTVDVTVPVGVTAVVVLPGGDPVEVGPGRHRFSAAHRAPADDPVWHPPPIPTDFD